MTTLIDTPEALSAFCARLSAADFVTVDTEFLREKTYWPQLCLIQMAGPDEAAAVDPLAEGMDLAPFYDLMADTSVLKVFHAARQDVEIFVHQDGRVPTPLFDSQVAAMVCGFGESVGYEALATKLAKARIDKSQRFTDWSHRPLTERQLDYAMADVIPLRTVYEKLRGKLDANGRAPWIEEEMAVLTDPATYRVDPEQSWKRLKARTTNPRFLARLREVAAWRERTAQAKNVPRNRIIKDDGLLEVAAHAPRTTADLARMRAVGRGLAEGNSGQQILDAVRRAEALPESDCPQVPKKPEPAKNAGPLVDLLKVLLKARCDQGDVAQKLVANAADLEQLAADDDADINALHGWRRELFGEDALKLKHGEVALVADDGRVELVELED